MGSIPNTTNEQPLHSILIPGITFTFATDMIPDCTDCHGSSEYSTHLGNDTEVAAGTAANCTQCHDNIVLNYTGSVFPSGLYNTNADIHSTSRTDMLPNQTANLNDSCSICHVTVYGETTRTHSNLNACYECHFDPDVLSKFGYR